MVHSKTIIVFLVGLGLCISFSLGAQEEEYGKVQYYRGVKQSYGVVTTLQADLDGDGIGESVICYREPDRALNQQGGVLILSGGHVAWHALFEGMYPEEVKANGNVLSFSLVQVGKAGPKKVNKNFELGKDFFFRSDEQSPFYDVKVSASSTLKGAELDPGMVFDGNLKTAWAEGGEGTGVDESVTLTFAKPVNLGLMGVLHGNFAGRRPWRDNNRLHRAEATVETSSDRFDADSGVDFEEDLGLGLYGDRVELSFTNKPIMRYFKVGSKNVTSLELKITSVLLGEKNDDTYIAEIDFAELIPRDVLLGKAKPVVKKKKKADDAPEPESKDDWVDDF